jgi:cytochrome P450
VPKWFPIPGRQQYLQDLSKVREKVNQIIVKCRQEKETSASLIQMLINAVDEESQQQMTNQQLYDEVMTIFMAGYETTAAALTWLGVVIQKHPDVLEKLRDEIDQVLGKNAPTFEDVPRLIYSRQVFMEILRMYTTAPFITRALNEADQIGEYHLPADALLLVFFHGVHHNPTVWNNPEVFDPERFTPDRIANQPPFAYMPFSAGPRKCAGNDFALLEGTLAIAMMLQKYNFNILPNQTFSAPLGGNLRPGNGVKATLALRTSS